MRRITRARASVCRQGTSLPAHACDRAPRGQGRLSRRPYHTLRGQRIRRFDPMDRPRSVSNRGMHGGRSGACSRHDPSICVQSMPRPARAVLRLSRARGRCAAGDSGHPQGAAPAAPPPFGAGGKRPSGAVGRRPSTRLDRNASKIRAPPSRMAQAVIGLLRPLDTIHSVFRINSGTCEVEDLKQSEKGQVGTVCDFGLLRRFRFSYEKRDG